MVQNEGNTGTIITVFSTASAVGKTVLAVNIAAQLAQDNFKVCIVDLDLQFGDVAHYLKLQPRLSIYHYQEKQNSDIAACLTTYNNCLAVLAAPIPIEESYNIELASIIAAVDELQKNYDYIIIDTAAGFSDINLVMMDISKEILFVGILDFLPTIKNMKIGYGTMLNIGYPREKIRFILNRSNAKKNIGVKDVEGLLGEKFYHALPNEFAIAITSIRAGVPMVYNAKVSEFGAKVQELVNKLLKRTPTKKEGSWLGRLFGG